MENMLNKWTEVKQRKGSMYNLGNNMMMRVKYEEGHFRIVDWLIYDYNKSLSPMITKDMAELALKRDLAWVRKIDDNDGKTYIKLVYYVYYKLDRKDQGKEAWLIDYEYDWVAWEIRKKAEQEIIDARGRAMDERIAKRKELLNKL